MGRKGEVCRIRLCGIRYNPFCLILRRSEKPCQACTAAIEDLQSQYLQAWGNLAPRAKIYITKALFSKGAHIWNIKHFTVCRITIYGDIVSFSCASAVLFVGYHLIQVHTVLACFWSLTKKTVKEYKTLEWCADLIGIIDYLLIPTPLVTVLLRLSSFPFSHVIFLNNGCLFSDRGIERQLLSCSWRP